jgi:heme-degrading monooxygenase HmoA
MPPVCIQTAAPLGSKKGRLMSATMIVKLQYSDWDKFKPFLDSANAHRKQFSGTGHTLARDLDDPSRVTVVVRFEDLAQAKAWVESTTDPKVLASISKDAALSAPPEIWLGEDIEDVTY